MSGIRLKIADKGDGEAPADTAFGARFPGIMRMARHTGVAVAIPDGYAGFIHPRSGLAHRLGLSMVNAPGTIDAGYRGEIKVNLVNLDPTEPVRIGRGDRIAQFLVQRVELWDVVEVDELGETDRGEGGHGSTGGHHRLT